MIFSFEKKRYSEGYKFLKNKMINSKEQIHIS